MRKIPRISLEQWATFRTVVEEGSFAKAADSLNKSQSTVSYAINRLNQLLPTPALSLNGRKAELTELGEVLYRYATHLLDQAQSIEETAKQFSLGWESELILTTDALSPMAEVFDALQTFSSTCTHTRIKILETSLSGTDETLFNRDCDMAITPTVPTGFLGTPLKTIKMVPVAHRHHHLAKMHAITNNDLRLQRQIVVRDTGLKRQQDAGWLGSEQRWTVSHFASSIEAVAAGLAFAFLPLHKIQSRLDSGEFVILSLATQSVRQIPLYLVVPQPELAGPAAAHLAKTLIHRFTAGGQ